MLSNLKKFLAQLLTKGYSNKTLYNYERDLLSFNYWLENIVHKNVVNIEVSDVNNFQSYLVSSVRKTSNEKNSVGKLSPKSINRLLSSIKTYLQYLEDSNIQLRLKPRSIKLIKTKYTQRPIVDLSDVIKLIEYPSEFEKGDKKVAQRNRAMLEVLFATGMRISELVNLNKNQIDNTGKIFITGKGRKQRFVYLTDRAKQHLELYLRSRSDTHPALFIPYRGTRAASAASRISPNYLQIKIKRYRELLRINVPTSAHSLRHGFATYLAESGANPAAIQILLGHESLDTTTRYVNASDKYAEDTHKKFHPLEK